VHRVHCARDDPYIQLRGREAQGPFITYQRSLSLFGQLAGDSVGFCTILPATNLSTSPLGSRFLYIETQRTSKVLLERVRRPVPNVEIVTKQPLIIHLLESLCSEQHSLLKCQTARDYHRVKTADQTSSTVKERAATNL